MHNIYVSQETKLLPRLCKDHSEERPPPIEEILGEKHNELKGKQLGSRTRLTEDRFCVHSRS